MRVDSSIGAKHAIVREFHALWVSGFSSQIKKYGVYKLAVEDNLPAENV